MTNADYIRSKIPLKDLIPYVERKGCEGRGSCLAKNLCTSTYPMGVCNADCKEIMMKWLKMERKKRRRADK